MKRWVGWLAVVGCAGGVAPSEPPDTDVAPGCDEKLVFDLPNLSCSQLFGVYQRLLDEASDCEVDADCQVLHTRCDILFIGACYTGANQCIDQQDLDEVVDAWQPCDDDPMSACPEPCEVATPRCDAGTCVASPAR